MRRMQQRKEPKIDEPMPPSPASRPKLFARPSSQPVMMSGKVSLFGTLNFHQSMMAAASMPMQMTTMGQLATLRRGLSNMGIPHESGISQGSGVRGQGSGVRGQGSGVRGQGSGVRE